MQPSVKQMNRKVMREVNQNTVLNLVRLHAPVSRTQLVALSGLSVGTIVGITSELLKHELVIEEGIASSHIGRKAGLLKLHPRGGYVIGLSLVEEDTIAAVLLNLRGEVIFSKSWQMPLRDCGSEVVPRIAQGAQAFISDCAVPREKILGIGCGLPGYVNADTGYSIDNAIHHWHYLSIAEPLSQLLGLPAYVDNIMNSLGSYEKLYGRGKQYRHFLVVTLGRGVGMAMILHGELYRGAFGGGGEFGHIICVPDGRLCECGKYGCLEAYLANRGLIQSYQELRQGDVGDALDVLTLADLALLAREGDTKAQQIFTQAGRFLGRHLATLVNLFNPECIILTGVDMQSHELMFDEMRSTLASSTFSSLGEPLSLVIEPVKDIRWAQGAGCLVLQRFFGSPLEVEAPAS